MQRQAAKIQVSPLRTTCVWNKYFCLGNLRAEQTPKKANKPSVKQTKQSAKHRSATKANFRPNIHKINKS